MFIYHFIQSVHASVQAFNFGITNHAVEALESAVDVFKTCQTKEANDLRTNCVSIRTQLGESVQETELTKKLDAFLKIIDSTLNLVSDPYGAPLSWTVQEKRCAGHNGNQTFEYCDKAKEFGKQKNQELNNDRMLEDTNVIIPTTKSKGNVAFTGFFAGATTVVGVVLCFIPPFFTAAPVLASAGGLINETKKEYDSIKYEVSWSYRHRDEHANKINAQGTPICSNKKDETVSKNTEAVQKALSGLRRDAAAFQSNKKSDKTEKENDSLKAEVKKLEGEKQVLVEENEALKKQETASNITQKTTVS